MIRGRLGVMAVASWTADDGAPVASLLLPAARHRAGLRTRMAAHVLGRVIDDTGVDAARLAIVHATRHAELGATLELLRSGSDSMTTRSVESLYDAAAARIGVAIGNRGFSTTVMAGSRTVAMGLLEAAAVLECVASEVALVVTEEAVPEPAGAYAAYDGLAVAMLLRRTDEAPWFLDDLGPRMTEPPPMPRLPASVAENPCSPALALVTALRLREARAVVLESNDDSTRRVRWCVDVRPNVA